MTTLLTDSKETVRTQQYAATVSGSTNTVLTDLDTIEDIENSSLFEDFKDTLRFWKRTRCFIELNGAASHFRSEAKKKNYNLKIEPAIVFVDVYWGIV